MTKNTSSKQTEREQRLSAALRANIKRRKQKTNTPTHTNPVLDQGNKAGTANENQMKNHDDLG